MTKEECPECKPKGIRVLVDKKLKGMGGGFFLALLLIAIGVILGIIVVGVKCPLTQETGFDAIIRIITTLGKGCIP